MTDDSARQEPVPAVALGRTGIVVTRIGFGAFKIGRNQAIKYRDAYRLPSEEEATRLLNGVLDLGIRYIDTAPAYGLSEQRIGRAISHRRDEFVLSSKVGEEFECGRSAYDFSRVALRASILRSLERLRSDTLDIVFIHSSGDDMRIMRETEAVRCLEDLKKSGSVRAIGFSGRTVEGARAALAWADAIMVEYHAADTSHQAVIAEAAAAGVGVVVKKGLASGRLDPCRAIPFVLDNPHVSSLIIGALRLDHMAQNLRAAQGHSPPTRSPHAHAWGEGNGVRT